MYRAPHRASAQPCNENSPTGLGTIVVLYRTTLHRAQRQHHVPHSHGFDQPSLCEDRSRQIHEFDAESNLVAHSTCR